MQGLIGKEITTESIFRWLGKFLGAYADGERSGRNVLIGYNTAPLAAELAAETGEFLKENGISSYLVSQATPWPAIHYLVNHKQLAGAIYFGGEKMHSGHISIWAVDGKMMFLGDREIPMIAERDHVEASVLPIDPRPSYYLALEDVLDITPIADSNRKIIVDCMYGSASGFVDMFLKRAGVVDGRGFSVRYEAAAGLGGSSTFADDGEFLKNVIATEEADIGLQFGVDGASAIGVYGGKIFSIQEMKEISGDIVARDGDTISPEDPILISLSWLSTMSQALSFPQEETGDILEQ